jgi:hypothetical protein
MAGEGENYDRNTGRTPETIGDQGSHFSFIFFEQRKDRAPCD